LSAVLEDRFGLLTRAGLHCAPRAHRTFGTDVLGGTVRVSFGAFNTIDDVDAVCDALGSIGSAVTSPVSSSSTS
jgi:selenocysteine lyase/cysteine desulfurase